MATPAQLTARLAAPPGAHPTAPRTLLAAGVAAVCLLVAAAPAGAAAPAAATDAATRGPLSLAVGSAEPLPGGGLDAGSATESLGGDVNTLPDGFDLQAHRGGIALNTESSPYSFGAAVRLGVTTLELDTQVTRDGKVVVTHDRATNPGVCTDTEPATPGDPQFPYVGKFVKDLTLAQIRTLDCGSVQKSGFPGQQTHPGSRMMLLSEVFDLVRASGDEHVRFNIETKVEAGAPEETAPREEFVRRVHEEIARSGMADRVSVQSFDWGSLELMHRLSPSTPLVALTNGDFLEVGEDGASPWLGGLDVDDFGGDGVAAAASIEGVAAYSPVFAMPQDCRVGDEGCAQYATREMVDRAHSLGLKVIPWTVDGASNMGHAIDAGVDGIITDEPDVLLGVLRERGIEHA